MIEITGVNQSKQETEVRVSAYDIKCVTGMKYSIGYVEKTPMGNKVNGNVNLPEEFQTRMEELFADLAEYYSK